MYFNLQSEFLERLRIPWKYPRQRVGPAFRPEQYRQSPIPFPGLPVPGARSLATLDADEWSLFTGFSDTSWFDWM